MIANIPGGLDGVLDDYVRAVVESEQRGAELRAEVGLLRSETDRLRGLVARYAEHVRCIEGTDFLNTWRIHYGGDVLTEGEIAELRSMRSLLPEELRSSRSFPGEEAPDETE